LPGEGFYIPIEIVDQFTRDLRNFEQRMSTAMRGAGRELDKAGAKALTNRQKFKALFNEIEKRTGITGQKLAQWGRRAALALTGFATAGVLAANQFSERMGNVATILTDTSQIEGYKKAILSMAKEGLGSATELADALYQTISAGVTKPADALQFLEKAAMGAKIGLASSFEAVDLGTTILNAFGYEASEAGRVFDEVQVAIREGKTTFAQLAASVGQAAPAFATAKLSSAELMAAMATLTKGGIDTANAATYLKNTVLQIINPAKSAAKVMDQLGIQYGAAAFKSKGLAGVFKEIEEKTKGNADALVQIVPNIRAFMAVASLAGEQSAEFARILDAENNALGEQAKRWVDVQKRADFALSQLKDSLHAALIEGFTPVLEAMAKWLQQGDNLKNLTKAFQDFASTVGNAFKWIIENIDLAILGIKALVAGWVLVKLAQVAAAFKAVDFAAKGAAISIRAASLAMIAWLAFDIGKAAREKFDETTLRLIIDTMKLATLTTAEYVDVLALQGDAGKFAAATSEQLIAKQEKLKESLEALQTELSNELGKWYFLGQEREAQAKKLSALRVEIGRCQDALAYLGFVIPKVTQREKEMTAATVELARTTAIAKENLKGFKDLLEGIKDAWPWQAANFGKGLESITGTMLNWGRTFFPAQPVPGDGTPWGDMLSFFGKDIPGALVKGWNLEIVPALASMRDLWNKQHAPSMASTFADNFVEGFKSALHNIGDIWKAFSIGLGDAISGMLGNMLDKVLDPKSFMGKMIGSMLPVVGQLASQALGALVKAFSGPTNEQLLASQGKIAGQIWGEAFSAEVASIMAKVAEKLPRALSGKVDVLAAMWHPETLTAVINELTAVTTAGLEQWARDIERHVKPVLMTTLGFSELEAAKMIAPLFEELMRKAIESGVAVGSEFERMIGWVKSLGIEMADVLGDAFKSIRDEIENAILGIWDARDALRGLRTERKEAREAAKEIRRQLAERGEKLRWKTEGGEVVRGGEAFSAIEAALYEATHGLTKGGKEKRWDRITVQEEKAILESVKGEDNKILVKQLIEAERTRLAAEQSLERQKIQIDLLKDQKHLLQDQRALLREIKNNTGRLVSQGGGGSGGGKGKPGDVEAQHGLDMVMSGPLSGYRAPITMHGTERVTVTPEGHGYGNGVTIENVNFNITADSSEGFKTWLRFEGEGREIADALASVIDDEPTKFRREVLR